MQTQIDGADLHCSSAPSLHQTHHICVPQSPDDFSAFSQLNPRSAGMTRRPRRASDGVLPLGTGTRVPCAVDQRRARFAVSWPLHALGHEEMLQEFDLPETELAAHEPPMSFKKLGLQAVYFSQWSDAQVMAGHSCSVTPAISPVGVTSYVALRRLLRREAEASQTTPSALVAVITSSLPSQFTGAPISS